MGRTRTKKIWSFQSFFVFLSSSRSCAFLWRHSWLPSNVSGTWYNSRRTLDRTLICQGQEDLVQDESTETLCFRTECSLLNHPGVGNTYGGCLKKDYVTHKRDHQEHGWRRWRARWLYLSTMNTSSLQVRSYVCPQLGAFWSWIIEKLDLLKHSSSETGFHYILRTTIDYCAQRYRPLTRENFWCHLQVGHHQILNPLAMRCLPFQWLHLGRLIVLRFLARLLNGDGGIKRSSWKAYHVYRAGEWLKRVVVFWSSQ